MKSIIFLCIQVAIMVDLSAQPSANYDESKVPPYVLPDILTLKNGQKVKGTDAWLVRRGELLSMFEEYVYGKLPAPPESISFHQMDEDPRALSGKATRKEIEIRIQHHGEYHNFRLLIYLPNYTGMPVPLFVGLNFFGNHSIINDPDISLTGSWIPNPRDVGIDDSVSVVDHKATEKSRGMSAGSWPVELILDRGYGLATIYYGDLMPDHPQGFKEGAYPLFYGDEEMSTMNGNSSAISIWAWGLSKAMDYFEKDKTIDSKKVVVIGHSRLGKTALWAGAQDTRFAMVISNNSGCGGAALSKRIFGETVGTINRAFPHWFCKRFKDFNEQEDKLPLDQHMLVALAAPRPVYIASAESDPWADPKGEFLAALNAHPVYKFLGSDGLLINAMPAVNKPSFGTIGYHIRTGEHGLTVYDWEQYLSFADVHFRGTGKK